MAVVLNPFFSTKARGSIGGITASRSGVGAVLKTKARIPRRTRPYQPSQRSIMGWCARQYGKLTTEQRAEWEAYATNHPHPDGFGGTFILTPEQAYLMLNVVAVRLGTDTALQTSPPAEDPPASIYYLMCEQGPADGDCMLGWTHLGTGVIEDFIDIQRAGPFQSPGRVEVHNRYREMRRMSGEALSYTYEGLIVDMWYWFRVRYVDKYGQVTNWMNVQWQAATIAAGAPPPEGESKKASAGAKKTKAA